jgi:hypothetical protein
MAVKGSICPKGCRKGARNYKFYFVCAGHVKMTAEEKEKQSTEDGSAVFSVKHI